VAGKRVELQLTQQELAGRAGVAQKTLAMLELGQRAGVSLGTLVALAEALGVSLDFLVRGEEFLHQEDDTTPYPTAIVALA
jgi:transcriptional regulator with XRE-family HTH domain